MRSRIFYEQDLLSSLDSIPTVLHYIRSCRDVWSIVALPQFASSNWELEREKKKEKDLHSDLSVYLADEESNWDYLKCKWTQGWVKTVDNFSPPAADKTPCCTIKSTGQEGSFRVRICSISLCPLAKVCKSFSAEVFPLSPGGQP